jgi:hypothetical protein
MGTCFLVQVLFVVHAHAFSTCVSWALAFFFCTSIFGHPSIHIYLYGEALFEELIIGEEMQDVWRPFFYFITILNGNDSNTCVKEKLKIISLKNEFWSSALLVILL